MNFISKAIFVSAILYASAVSAQSVVALLNEKGSFRKDINF